MTWRVAGAAQATIGMRANQEDAFAIWPPGAQVITPRGEGLLAVVADGMGGHAGGEIAGDLASRTFVETFIEVGGWAGGRLRSALETANSAIATHAARNASLRGMGSTLIGAWIDSAGLRWVSVGDSLLLLFRASELRRLNADHSLGAFLDDQARRNKIPAAEAQNNPYRNALRSALTGKSIELIDLREAPYPLAHGDWIILASDGLTTLGGDEIGDIVYANRESTPDRMAGSLITAVLEKEAPEQDNATVLALKIIKGEIGPAYEAPTRVLRRRTPPVASLLQGNEGIAITRRVAQPLAIQALLRRHRNWVLGIGMGLMFVIGWLLRAALG